METIGLNVKKAEKILSKKGFFVICLEKNEELDIAEFKQDLDNGPEYMILTQDENGIVTSEYEYHG